MKRFFRNYWPVLVLLCVELVIAAVNYKPGTFLMGWDNVMPEFNFRQAFITNIFGVWQEHRGVGLPDGMGHAANLVHTVFTWALSIVAPQNTIRYIVQFFLHFLGMIGVLRVIREIRGEEKNNTLAFVGALFYGFNLITIQMFYTPLEAFSFHYAALPWLAYSLLRYLRQPSRNTLLLFTTVSFLSTPQFFIPTLLLPTGILMGAIGVIGVIRDRNMIKPALAAGATFLYVNAFWLLPYLYNLPYNAPVIQNAKINRMSSEEVYERNKAFGDIGNVVSFRGFMLDFEDVNAEGQPVFVMNEWRNWINQPAIRATSIALALLMLFGIRSAGLGFTLIWVISFFFLANNTPGISDVLNVIRDRFPVFAEGYRFPFTKFSLLFAFAGTVLLVQGLSLARRDLARLIIPFIIVLSFPVFQGHFFYDALRVNLPENYLSLFSFMEKQDHSGRTAYLPQPSYWSWKRYKFGYVGSGFIWYGLPQPLMERAFDPWSQYNEQYYWDLSHAIYGKNAEKLEQVFETYDIRYIILDENLRAPGHDRALFTEETKELLANLKHIATFGALSIYERDTQTSAFIYATETLPSTDIRPRFGEPANLVFSTENSQLLTPQAVKPCGVLKSGDVSGELIDGALRLRSRNQRACISFGANTLPHTSAYRVEVVTKNISGRPLLFAVINETAKHVEVEEYLTGNDTFYLPPLASDGLGYTVYFSNDAIVGETVNDIISVAFYEVEYQEKSHADSSPALTAAVSHPNPAYYRVTIPKNAKGLQLSQAYNPNWLALSDGKLLGNHTKVNGWANGWELAGDEKEVAILFWPQILEFIGFGMIAVMFIFIYRHKRFSTL